MARKEPFRTINVRRKILEALEPLRLKESAVELREWSVNAFCERILWDYAKGKIGFTERAVLSDVNRMVRPGGAAQEENLWDALPPEGDRRKRVVPPKVKGHHRGKVSNE